jgi:cytochrome c5
VAPVFLFLEETSMSSQDNAFKSVMYAAIGIAVLVMFVVVIALFRSYAAPEGIEDPDAGERIRPMAVFIKSDHKAPEVAEVTEASAAVSESTAPTDIYASFCHVCHETGVAGAPRRGDSAAWEPRIAAGIDALYQSALTGKGAMPPRGNTTSASDDDIKATVDFLIGEAR